MELKAVDWCGERDGRDGRDGRVGRIALRVAPVPRAGGAHLGKPHQLGCGGFDWR